MKIHQDFYHRELIDLPAAAGRQNLLERAAFWCYGNRHQHRSYLWAEESIMKETYRVIQSFE
jgi:hypothetical protein